MATVPTSHTFGTGVATSSEMNTYVRDPLDFLMNKPAFHARQTVAQSIPNNTGPAITFTTEDLDDDPVGTGGHDNVTNNTRFTAVYAGWYRLSGGVGFAANATGVRTVSFSVNGTAVNGSAAYAAAVAGGPSSVLACRSVLVFLNVGDYVELNGFQNSGGALNTSVTTSEQSTLTVVWERLA